MKIELPLDGSTREAARHASDVVFKSKFHLELLVLMSQQDRFYHGEMLSLVPGVGPAHVTSFLERYLTGGVIHKVVDESSRQYYAKTDPESPFWSWATEWAAEIDGG